MLFNHPFKKKLIVVSSLKKHHQNLEIIFIVYDKCYGFYNKNPFKTYHIIIIYV